MIIKVTTNVKKLHQKREEKKEEKILVINYLYNNKYGMLHKLEYWSE